MLGFTSFTLSTLCAISFSFSCASFAQDASAVKALSSKTPSDKGAPALKDAPSAAEIDLLKLAAASGDAHAQYRLGRMLHEGEGIERNRVKGLELLELAAASGYAPAQGRFGELLYFGQTNRSNSPNVLKKNRSRAVKLLNLAATSGDAQAQYTLARMLCKDYLFHNCKDVENHPEGLKWFQRAADNGHIEAQYYFGKMLYMGDGVEKNQARGIELLQRAADSTAVDRISRHTLVQAQCLLGRILYLGRGVEKNQARGIALLELALGGENSYCVDDKAQCLLGKILYYGQGTEKNKARGIALLKLSAASGNARAKSLLQRIPFKEKN